MTLTLTEGRRTVELARSTVQAHVRQASLPDAALPPVFEEKRGVFVTINRARNGPEKLRGCIGFPYPVRKLGAAIRNTSVAAASEDPRFPPVNGGELDAIVFEVSVLTRPIPIESEPRSSLPSKLRIGEDGLIVSDANSSGLLLPQVATKFGMGQVEFLSQASVKAGLSPGDWLDRHIKIEVFQAEIFSELEPNGEVVRIQT